MSSKTDAIDALVLVRAILGEFHHSRDPQPQPYTMDAQAYTLAVGYCRIIGRHLGVDAIELDRRAMYVNSDVVGQS